ncbi:M48 family metallopeptidase [uncultured Pseudomonas sp.]|uniref:M48 family metallopeptidase n=1 Tax=uncultured Pseudomonas sp. TaxID=114707 RepID=UPI0025F97C35|nr:M48 family metallopeptidase [uncultured Pseudomonas sp.]
MNLTKRLWWALPVILLPLLLMAWTAQQSWRANHDLETAEIMRQWIATSDDTLLAKLSARERNEVIRPEDRAHSFQRQIDRVDADAGSLHLRAWLGELAYWLAVAALLAGIGTWLKIRIDAWRARLSQDFLEQRLARSWHVLGRCLIGYTGLLVGALGLALLYEISWGYSNFKQGGLSALIIVLSMVSMICAGVVMIDRLRRQWTVLESPSSSFLGRTLSLQQAPAVWAWVRSLAEQVGAPTPDHLVVGLDQSFFVTSVPVVLQPSGQALHGRTLYLPLTALCALSQAETAAIIGHELGHFRSQDTERSSALAAQFGLMCAHYASLTEDDGPPPWLERPALWMAGQFLEQFERAVQHWSRVQELAADRVGAQVAGTQVFGQALLRIIALDEALPQVLAARGGDNLLQAWQGHLREHPLVLDEQVLQHALAHPFDSHPPTALRLRELKVKADAELLATATRVPSEEDRRWFEGLLGAQQAPRRGASA